MGMALKKDILDSLKSNHKAKHEKYGSEQTNNI
jgi:hypothetical protein